MRRLTRLPRPLLLAAAGSVFAWTPASKADAPTPVRVVSATSLASFDGIEEPLLRYTPATRQFAPDDYVNIRQLAPGDFRMELRFRGDWWDSDRDTENRDRQRAEVKGLGPHQKDGETFDYTTTWRTDPDFRPATRFCHVFQLKATNGDNGAPAVTMTITSAPGRVAVRYTPVGSRSSGVAREFGYTPGVWESVRIRIKVSAEGDGALLVSLNGDPFRGLSRIALFRPAANDYRPKWGLYRGVTPGMPIHDDYIEHKDISAEKIDATAADIRTGALPPAGGGAAAREDAALEAAAGAKAHDSPPTAIAWLESGPPSAGRDAALATVAALWSESDAPSALAWALAFPSVAVRQDAISRIYSRWEARDFDAAQDWLRSRAPDPRLDDLLWYRATDTTLRYVRRPAALESAGFITDPLLRDLAYEHVVGIWARVPAQRAAAILYVRQTGRLDAEQKQRLIRKIGGGADSDRGEN